MLRTLSLVLSLAFCAACASVPADSTARDLASREWSGSESTSPIATAEPERPAQPGDWNQAPGQEPAKKPRQPWKVGQAAMQGFIGANFLTNLERNGGSTPNVEQSESETTVPVIGGGGMWKLAGDNFDFGLEAMLSIGWRANAAAFASGSGGAVLAVNVDLVILDLFGGPFINKFIGDNVRVYASIGPLLEFADYDQSSNIAHESGTGFGAGGYARTGIEFALPSGTMLGLGARWSQCSVSLSNNLGNLHLDGVQAVLTVTEGF
jgi:hypothetical protein